MDASPLPSNPGPGAARTGRACILIVDDQPLNIRVLHHVLAADHRVLMATGGEQALALCRTQKPDLVLLDVQMPVMDGYEVCARLKADEATRAIPVVFVTAHESASQRLRGEAAGAAGFITKPVEPPLVLALIRRLLGGAGPP